MPSPRRTLRTCLSRLVVGLCLGGAVATSAFTQPSTFEPLDRTAPETQEALVSEDAHRPRSAQPLPWGEVIGEVRLRGLKSIENDAVFAKLTTKRGTLLRAAAVREDIQVLYHLGYFDDIALDLVENRTARGELIVQWTFTERPVIASIQFEGNEKISASDLKDVVKVKQWSILDINLVREDVKLIQKHYEEKGFYLAKVSYAIRVRPAESKGSAQVELVYQLNDYDKIQVKKIQFLNAHHFTQDQLKTALGETREGHFLSFLTSAGNFKDSAFRQDLQRLIYFYYDHGFVKFNYENPIITISDDKKWLYLSLYVNEGEAYRVGEISFSGDMLFSQTSLANAVLLKKGEIFAFSQQQATLLKLTEKYQDLGYAFTNVIPKTVIHEDTRTIDITYDFEKGYLVSFGQITILDNSKTFDRVIRRELKIREGELYNGTQMRLSKENIERLGYFAPGEIVFNTVSPPGHPNVLNVDITVKERQTGSFNLGAGFGSYQRFVLSAQVAETNIFGRGQTISLAAQYSLQQLGQSFNLAFTDPYAFDTLWSAGFDLFSIKYPIPYRWTTSKLGFDLRLGHPILDYTYAYLTYKFEGVQDLNADPSVSASYLAADTGNISSFEVSVTRDKRNNRLETTAGNYQNVSVEMAGAGGNKKYVKATANNRWYVPLVGSLVLRNSTKIGNIWEVGGEPVPPSQKFYLGGPQDMKGYQMFMMGPNQRNSQDRPMPLGGNVEAYSLFEAEYPLLKDAGLKGVVFFDVGNLWDHLPRNGEPWVVRTDAGVGVRWFSPMGMLRFEWGFPLKRKPDESPVVFQFFMGPPF